MMNLHMVAGLLHDVSYGLSCLKWCVVLKMNEQWVYNKTIEIK